MTTATINKELKKLQLDVKMYKGKGYYYFISDVNIPSLYSMTLQHYTLPEIIEHIKSHIK